MGVSRRKEHALLMERIKCAQAALKAAPDTIHRDALLDELGAATRELAELILQQQGRLRSPLE